MVLEKRDAGEGFPAECERWPCVTLKGLALASLLEI